MDLLENVFLGMFLLGFLFTIVSALMSGAFGHAFGEGSAMDAHGAHIGHMGGDASPPAGEGTAEVGWAQHNLSTFSPLSPTVISSFFAAAGGIGFLCVHSWEWGFWSSILASVVAGTVFGGLVFVAIGWMFRVTQGTSLVSQGELVGVEGEVSIAITSGSLGEISYVRAGQRCVRAARCADAATVPKGAKVVIKAVSSSEFVVEETRESWLGRSKGRGAPAAS
jgi:hypothetical protein